VLPASRLCGSVDELIQCGHELPITFHRTECEGQKRSALDEEDIRASANRLIFQKRVLPDKSAVPQRNVASVGKSDVGGRLFARRRNQNKKLAERISFERHKLSTPN